MPVSTERAAALPSFRYPSSIVMCTEEIHQMLIHEEDAINCIFCNKQIQDPGKPKRYFIVI